MILNDNEIAAVRLVTLYNRHELINNRVMERLYNCIRNGIYVTCSMYDEFESLEDKKELEKICSEYNSIAVGNVKNIYKDKNIYPNMDI